MVDIKLEHITKKYNTSYALNDITLDIKNGERIAILGESGAGKTTLLRIIAGLEQASEGHLYFDDQIVDNKKPYDRHIAMIFQDALLFEHSTVQDNIIYGLHKLGYTKDEIHTKLIDVSKLLHIDSLLKRYPASLSSGEKQRVGIARALIRDPDILLLDEPFSSLDDQLRNYLINEILEIQKKKKFNFFMVTHNQEEAFLLGDKILLLKDGKLVEFNTPYELYHYPNMVFSASFISPSMNLLHGIIQENKLLYQNKEVKEVDLKDQDVMIGVRPENIHICENGLFKATVVLSRYIGDTFITKLQYNDEEITIYTKNEITIKEITFSIGNEFVLFDREGNRILNVQ